MKLRSFFFLVILLFAAQCFAAMTLWFKDGTSVQVYKVVFQGEMAEITLLDGNTRKVPVKQLDLQSSGIFKPEGTYGGKGSAPVRVPLSTPPSTIKMETRQQQLKEEWDRAEKKAVALKDIGAIRRGDIVHIVGETPEPAPKKPTEYSDYYTPPPPPQDDAYVIIYRTPDGTYTKKLFDAATFTRDFRIEKDPEPQVVMPVEPRIPEDKTAKPVESTKPSPAPVQEQPAPQAPLSPVPQEHPSSGEEEESAPVWPILLAIVVIAVGTVIVVALRRRPKGFINSSRFSHYEEELRDFEIEIWLKHGKTMEQLVEVCVKKFYSDQPGPLSAITKIQKGLDKNAVVAFIAKQGNMDAKSAERIHTEMQQRLDWIRTTIQAVSQRTGKHPLPETTGAAAPTGIIAVPSPASTASSKPAKPAVVPPAQQESQRPPTAVISVPGATAPPRPRPQPPVPPPVPVAQQTDIPAYLENVLRDLAMLSENREE